MLRERRTDDVGGLRVTQVTPEGYLLAEVAATRTGVFEYVEDGKTVRELRPRDEVEKSLASLARIPLAIRHPRNDDGEPIDIDASNAAELAVGLTDWDVKLTRDGWARTAVQVLRADAREAAEQHPGVSCGYWRDRDETSGWWSQDEQRYVTEKPTNLDGWEPFDRIQRHISYNHLAIGVPVPRAGEGARLAFDSAFDEPPREKKKMPQMDIDGVIYDVADDLVEPIKKLKADAADARSKRDELQGQVAVLESAAADKPKQGELDEDFVEAFNERLEAIATAVDLGIAVDELSDKPTSHIVRAVVAKQAPKLKLDDASDDTVRGAYRAVQAMRSGQKRDASEGQRHLLSVLVNDDQEPAESDRRTDAQAARGKLLANLKAGGMAKTA